MNKKNSSDVYTIIAGGASAKALDFSKLKGTLIGVNDSAFYHKCDIVVSMDRLWTENRWEWLKITKPRAFIRSAALKNCKERWGNLTVFECDHKSTEMSLQPGILNGTNSGLCAVNLACQLNPDELYLVGFDLGTTEGHWYDNYSWAPTTSKKKYAGWKNDFVDVKNTLDKLDCSVINLNPLKTIKQFRNEWNEYIK